MPAACHTRATAQKPMAYSPQDLKIAPAYSALIELIAALTPGLCEYARYFERASMMR